MKVKLIPEISYRVETENGEPLGVFTRGEEWKGMTEYVDGTNELIVRSPTESELIFSNVFSEGGGERVAEVVQATSKLFEQLRGKTETETEAEAAK